MKPLVFYVDDEPNNLVVFESAMPSDWEVRVFDNPLDAIEALKTVCPWVVVSDQKMPGMRGVTFLEAVKISHPSAKRVIVTGFSDEDLVIESLTTAQVHDYIRKPWDVDELVHRLTKIIETYQLESNARKNSELIVKQNEDLKQLNVELVIARDSETAARQELECWAPPFVLEAIRKGTLKFPFRKTLVVITYDIIGSSKYHDIYVGEILVRALIMQEFTKAVVRNGGWREITGGDAAYAHFGLVEATNNPAASALAAARELRDFLRSLATKEGIEVDCGIGLHIAENSNVNVNTVIVDREQDTLIIKALETASREIDLVFRVEKLMHNLPGSTIGMSEEFINAVGCPRTYFKEIGLMKFEGQRRLVRVYIEPSRDIDEKLIDFIRGQAFPESDKKSG